METLSVPLRVLQKMMTLRFLLHESGEVLHHALGGPARGRIGFTAQRRQHFHAALPLHPALHDGAFTIHAAEEVCELLQVARRWR